MPAGVFNLVNGDGPGVGAALSRAQATSTWSASPDRPAPASRSRRPPRATVKRVHQELGGKAPNLVLEGADLAAVLPPTVAGRARQFGPELHRADPPARPREPGRRGDRDREGDDGGDRRSATPAEMGAHIGPVVNKAQFDKIQGLIQSAIDEGATLVTGGTGRPDGRNARLFRQADAVRRRDARHAHRARGNVRPGRDDHRL